MVSGATARSATWRNKEQVQALIYFSIILLKEINGKQAAAFWLQAGDVLNLK